MQQPGQSSHPALLNLTLASPGVNRHQKVDNDAAESVPELNERWYVGEPEKAGTARIWAIQTSYVGAPSTKTGVYLTNFINHLRN